MGDLSDWSCCRLHRLDAASHLDSYLFFQTCWEALSCPHNTIPGAVNQTGGKALQLRETSFLLSPERHTSPPAAHSLPFQSSQGHRSWTYLLFTLLSSPPFPPGSSETVCKFSTSFLTCYLCKTGPSREIHLPGAACPFLPGVCLTWVSLQKTLWVEAGSTGPPQRNSSFHVNLFFKILNVSMGKSGVDYKVLSNISEYFCRRRLYKKWNFSRSY